MRKGDYQTGKQATNYHKSRFSGGLLLVHQDEVSILKRAARNLNQNQKVVDLGAGTGRIINELSEFSPKETAAIDQSQAMLDFIKKRFKKKVIVKKARSEKTGLKTNSYNLVTAFHLFKHLENPTPTIKEASRILKNEGVFVFDVLNKNSIISFNLDTCYSVNSRKIIQALKKNGFRNVECHYLNFLGETVYKIIGTGLGKIFRPIDKAVSSLGLGTKIVFIAQK